ncbi:MAG: DsbA family protein [Roseobacter sp.]
MFKRSLICLAFLGTMLTPASALDLSAMTDAEREAFREEVRAYLMENPQVILDAVNSMEERQAAAQAVADVERIAENAEAIFNDGFSYVGGNPDGDITVVEFLDYRCGFCKRAFGEIEQLLENDGNIRLIIKEFPILGEESVMASRYAIATRQIAGGDAYKALHDALMVYRGNITLQTLRRLASTLDLDTTAIEAQMDAPEVTAELRATRDLAQTLQISGTPTFVVETEMLRGFLPFDQMQALVSELRG